MSNIAPVKWAQRKDSLYLTISLPDVTEPDIKLTNNRLTFNGLSGGKSYTLDLELFQEIETEGSIWNVLPSSIQMKLVKKDKDSSFWPRLLLDKIKEKTNVKVDWDRYVDEDEAVGGFDEDNLYGGMDFGGMGGMGGMPGMGGMGGMPGMGGMGGLGGMPGMGGLGGIGGMPGMGGMPDFGDMDGDEDDDDDDLPDLEPNAESTTGQKETSTLPDLE